MGVGEWVEDHSHTDKGKGGDQGWYGKVCVTGPGEGSAEDSKPPFPQGDGGYDLVLPHSSCDGDLAVGLTMNVWLG